MSARRDFTGFGRTPLYGGVDPALRAHEPIQTVAGSNKHYHVMNKSKLLWLAIPLAAMLGWLGLGGSPAHARVGGHEAKQLVANGATLVDVRTPSEFGEKHLPGATNVPLQQLGERWKELQPKDRAIVLYCRSGHRSGIAYDQLKSAGFSRLFDLGPMTAW